MPAGGGVGTARAMAHAYGVFASGGRELGLRQETLDLLAAPAIPPAHGFYDECLKGEVQFSLGFMKPSANWRFGGPRSFGSPGTGGALGFADPDAGHRLRLCDQPDGHWSSPGIRATSRSGRPCTRRSRLVRVARWRQNGSRHDQIHTRDHVGRPEQTCLTGVADHAAQALVHMPMNVQHCVSAA